jgi:hypothetical protein
LPKKGRIKLLLESTFAAGFRRCRMAVGATYAA